MKEDQHTNENRNKYVVSQRMLLSGRRVFLMRWQATIAR